MPAPSTDILTIHTIRKTKVILDSDLAKLYGVTTKRLLEQMRRNAWRFPEDFAFRLRHDEYVVLRSQIAPLKSGRGQHRKYLPFAFTEHGALQAANVLNSPRAVPLAPRKKGRTKKKERSRQKADRRPASSCFFLFQS